ncbi:MAG: hypothetical protein ACJ8ER_12370 [Allosphingosinicella sp.]
MSGKRHDVRDEHGRFVAAEHGPGAAGTELVWKGGGGDESWAQLRRKNRKGLTKGQILTFLAALAETCNAAHAARLAKRSAQVFYALRGRNAAFRTAWNEALSEGYDFLEIELVRRARFGAPKDIFYQGEKTATTLVYNDGTSLRLLQAHRRSIEHLRASDREEAPRFAVLIEALAARIAEIEAEEPGDETA